MMRCHEMQPLLSEWLDGELEDASAQEVATHLDGCTDCRRRLEELAVPSRALREIVPQAAPSGFEGRLAARWLQEGIRTPEGPRLRLGAARLRIAALLLSAAVLLAVLVLSFLAPSALRETKPRVADEAVPTVPSEPMGIEETRMVDAASGCSSPVIGTDCWFQTPCSSELDCPSPEPMARPEESQWPSFESLQLPADTPGRLTGFDVAFGDDGLPGVLLPGELEFSGS